MPGSPQSSRICAAGITIALFALIAFAISDERAVTLRMTPPALQGTHEDVGIVYYAAALRIDPPVAIPGTDLDALARTIDALEESAVAIAALYPPEQAEKIERSLYPTTLLRAVRALEESRRDVLKRPKPVNIEEHYQRALQTFAAYHAALSRLDGVFSAIQEDAQPGRKYNFIGGTATVANFRSALTATQKNISVRKEKLQKRYLCRHGMTAHCQPVLLPSISDTFTLQALSVKEQSGVKSLRAILTEYFDQTVGPLANTPKMLTSSNRCFAETSHFLTFTYPLPQDTRLPVFSVEYVDDIYFYRTKGHSAPLIGNLSNFGVPLLYQSLTNLYFCPEFSILYPRIRTTIELQDTSIENLDRTAREKLRNANTHTPMLATLLEQHLLARTRTAGFNEILNASLEDNAIVIGHARTGHLAPLTDLFISRSYPILMFQLFNRTVMDAPPAISNPPAPAYASFGLLSYEEDLANRYSSSQIRALMIKGFTIQRR